jgi:gliding motility-associated-like protein
MWWSNGSTEQAITINSAGTYEAYAWNNCRRYIHTIEVKQRDAADCIWLPSVFSPNGDGKNDAFGPVFSCYTLPQFYTLHIYNRFGECVFETENAGEKWDGNYKGELADVGAYYYMLRYSAEANDPDATLLKGDLTLLR